MEAPSEATRAVVRNVIREAMAVLFSLTILGLFLANVITPLPITVELSQIQTTFVDGIAFLFFISAGFLLWGKRTIEAAIEVYKSLGQS